MITAVVLAAGESTRFEGYPKALLELGGLSLLARVCRSLKAGGVEKVRVVVGHRAAEVAPAARALGCEVIEHREYRRGMLSSVRAGTGRLPEEITALVLAPVDHPLFGSETVALLLRRFHARGHGIVLPRCGGRRGHPVLFGAELIEELRAAPDSVGARAVVWADPGRVEEVEVADPGVLIELDDPQGLEAARAWLEGRSKANP
ncbi:MAG TPA: nucleotidyltransferase family protein [Acidobacteriota bacterium]